MDFWKKWNRHKKIPSWAYGVGMSICFFLLGAGRNQFSDIYRKAVRICLECIGIG